MMKPPKGSGGKKYDVVLELENCIAKTVKDKDDNTVLGIDVYTHCLIVGLIARELIQNLPAKLREEFFPVGAELIAASHDIGKICPHFQEKIYRSRPQYTKNSQSGLEDADPSFEKQLGYHSGVGQSALDGLDGLGKYIPQIVGAHHGRSIDCRHIKDSNAEILGGRKWQQQRLKLVELLKTELKANWPVINSDLQARLITGLTIVSDWIGSNSHFEFTHNNKPAIHSLATRVQNALTNGGLKRPKIQREQTFQSLFHSYNPYPVQEEFISRVNGPGLYILEDQMGRGKTEAALLAAYNMMDRGIACGIYFALPTTLTSEKMYDRFNEFTDKILDYAEKHRALVAHGKAWRYDHDWGEDARPGHSWFAPRKRALLAPFAVGTIDQALMSVLNVKHSSLRLFGLSTKVVILDEVHTYDAYTGTLLDTLISSLYKLGCVVIVLSATLQNDRKKEIFAQCRGDADNTADISIPDHYPQISSLPLKVPLSFSPPYEQDETEQRSVAVHSHVSDADALNEALDRALRGDYVLWIENTVREAQEIYRVLGARGRENGVEIGLLHSRFTALDREKREKHWVNKLGKGRDEYTPGVGCILIGTQVLEQSLDIDADFLVTRLAPSDMLLQRTGRLWRHTVNNALRHAHARPDLYVLMPSPDNLLQELQAGRFLTGKVYAPYVLLRTCEVWQNITELTLPGNIREIINKTYKDRQETEPLQQTLLKDLRDEKEKLQRFARLGTATAGHTQNDNDTVPTRYSEQQTVEVLLLKNYAANAQSRVLTFPDNTKLTISAGRKATPAERRETAKILYRHILSVPEYQAPERYSRNELNWLSPYLYLGDKMQAEVALAIIGESGILHGLRGEEMSDAQTLRYNDTGYVAEKHDKRYML